MSAGGPNRLALEWIDLALRLEDENRRLREFALALLLWIARNEDLLAVAEAQAARRFGRQP